MKFVRLTLIITLSLALILGVCPSVQAGVDLKVEIVSAKITGTTGEVNCSILPDTTVVLFQDGVPIYYTASDGNGDYTLPVPQLGDYEVMVFKAGFRSETQSISVTEVTYTLDFRGEHGLVPKAATMSYVLGCINHWLYPEPPCGLSMSRVLVVINAWLYPQ